MDNASDLLTAVMGLETVLMETAQLVAGNTACLVAGNTAVSG